MDLQRIAAKLTEVDLQELLVRYVMNDAVIELKADGRPVTWQNISQVIDSRRKLIHLLTPSTLQPMFELVSGQYMRGGWKDQIQSAGKIVALTEDEVQRIWQDLEYMRQHVANTKQSNAERTNVLVKLA